MSLQLYIKFLLRKGTLYLIETIYFFLYSFVKGFDFLIQLLLVYK